MVITLSPHRLRVKSSLAYLEATAHAPDNEKLPAVLDDMKRAVTRTDRIISEILDYVREPLMEITDFPLSEAIQDAVELDGVPEVVSLDLPSDESGFDSRRTGWKSKPALR